MRFLKDNIPTLLMLVTVAVMASAATVNTDLLRLRPRSVPSSCSTGDVVISSSDSKLKYCLAGTFADVVGSSAVPAGSVFFFAGSSAPSGYLLAYGQAVSRTTYSDLFTAISTTYGSGDGSTTFNLPDCRGRVIAGEDDMGGSSANRLTNQSGGLNGDTLGATGGAETHTLSSSEMPAHTHDQKAGDAANHVHSSTSGSFAGRDWYGLAANLSSKAMQTTSSTGGGGAHNNVQPTIILGCIIKI